MQTTVDQQGTTGGEKDRLTGTRAQSSAVPVGSSSAARRRRRVRPVLRQLLLLALVTPLALLFLMPWAWMLSTAGKPTAPHL